MEFDSYYNSELNFCENPSFEKASLIFYYPVSICHNGVWFLMLSIHKKVCDDFDVNGTEKSFGAVLLRYVFGVFPSFECD